MSIYGKMNSKYWEDAEEKLVTWKVSQFLCKVLIFKNDLRQRSLWHMKVGVGSMWQIYAPRIIITREKVRANMKDSVAGLHLLKRFKTVGIVQISPAKGFHFDPWVLMKDMNDIFLGLSYISELPTFVWLKWLNNTTQRFSFTQFIYK